MEQYAEAAADVGSVYVEREHQCRSRYAVPQAEVYAEVVAAYHPTQEHIYAFGGRAFVDVRQVFLYSCGVGQMSQIALSKMQLLNRNLLIEAAKEGDEEAIDTLSTDELKAYSSINSRIQNEDVYSIVDTLFMPYGMEADMYTIVGAITDIKEETNSMTGESLLILQVESNDIPLSIALKKEDLQGEPMIGRRFKGNVWMLGNIKPEAAAK